MRRLFPQTIFNAVRIIVILAHVSKMFNDAKAWIRLVPSGLQIVLFLVVVVNTWVAPMNY